MFFLNKKGLIILIFAFTVIVILALTGASKIIVKHIYPLKYKEYVYTYSMEYKIDPFFVFAIMKAESNFRPDVVSRKGAIGLMQITPETGRWIASELKIADYNDNMLFDPETNIMMGTWYLRNLSDEFGDVKLVIAAYNGGRGNVEEWLKNKKYSKDGRNLDNIPYLETDIYTQRVLKNYKIYRALYAK
ncbi:soluble lytic murein transglycosylase [Caldanaerobius fijiensis DSM 17918]|uniref:Soluble lytic murein transglycosylase n=1 Tax=Caldanaerobius fijiensis DSM 17918 TaxID=1121256 RepID=A0A1M4VKM3_9THEO|nr:lytic transglycosylase domain-containing protein [Caldanaerobius fijiensis]SHE69430.1 soluble lytic murein transglycosylase [Caldanaerobius fijiensis DSM 17918]